MKVLHITPESNNINLFDEYVEQDKDIFILIHLEGCGPCIATLPQWKEIENKLKNKYKSNDNLILMDVNQLLLDKMTKLKKEIVGFPTILYITDKGEKIEEYDEADEKKFRKVDSFVKWIDSKMNKQKGGKKRTIKKKKTRRSRIIKTRRNKKTRRTKNKK